MSRRWRERNRCGGGPIDSFQDVELDGAMMARGTTPAWLSVVGVGPGNGAAFARRFGAEGYAVALLARSTGLTSRLANELPVARAYACDVGDPAAVERTFASIESDLGSVAVLIYNAG